MSKELELYQAFIDGLVERKDSMTALWVKGDGFPKTENNKAKNDLLTALTPEQKDVLAEMLQDEHIAGIHDTGKSRMATGTVAGASPPVMRVRSTWTTPTMPGSTS